MRVDGRDGAADQMFSGSVGRKGDELSFICVTFQPIPA